MSIRDYFLQGSGLIRIAQVVLSDDEIKALGGDGIDLISGPGANKQLQFLTALYRARIVVGYNGLVGSSALILKIGGMPVSQFSVISGAFGTPDSYVDILNPLNGAVGLVGDFAGILNSSPLNPSTSLVDQPLTMIDWLLPGNYTGGDPANKLTVTCLYAVLDI